MKFWNQALNIFKKRIPTSIFNIKNSKLIKNSNTIILNYFCLIFKKLLNRQKTILNNPILAFNKYIEIELLQTLFIHSIAIKYYSIHNISTYLKYITLKINERFFLQSSNKYWKDQKNLLKLHLSKLNNNLNVKLFQNYNAKDYQTYFKTHILKWIWLSKDFNKKTSFLSVYTLQNWLFKIILYASSYPIIKYLASFSIHNHWYNNSILNSLNLFILSLIKLDKAKNFFIKVSKKIYTQSKNWRYCMKTFHKTKNVEKYSFNYFHTYYIYTSDSLYKHQTFFQRQLNFFLININIFKYLKNNNCRLINKTYPIHYIYLYFVNNFLQHFIYSSRCTNSKNWRTQISKNTIFQESKIKLIVIDCIFNTFKAKFHENAKYPKVFQILNTIQKSKQMQFMKNLFLLGSPNNILVFYKSTFANFTLSYKIFIMQLKKNGLIAESTNTIVTELKFNFFFDFLGFRFIYANNKKKKLDNFKFNYNFYVKGNTQKISTGIKKRLLIVMEPTTFKNCRNKIHQILSSSNSLLSINNLIAHYNCILRKLVNYFIFAKISRAQLKYLDYLSSYWFRNLLLKKFGSTPKLYSFIKLKYYSLNNKIRENNEEQLKTTTIKQYNTIFFCF